MDEYFYEIFNDMPRLGPGSSQATLKALDILNLDYKPKKVLDIGCGTGAQTFILANELNGQITALDNYQPYLDQIEEKKNAESFKARIKCHCMDMNKIVCKDGSLDLVWAEGSIYIVGFKKGLDLVYPMLKNGAHLVFSDMNYLRSSPPSELADFLDKECPDIISKEENIQMIEDSKYELKDQIQLEIDLYKKYPEYYGYVFYLMKKME